jgi:hypothetical protein
MLSKPRVRLAFLALALTIVSGVFGSQARASEILGVPLPTAAISSNLTQGGPPDFADTFVTPYVTSSGGTVTGWKAQFLGGMFPAISADQGGPFDAGPGVPVGIQLKVLRYVSPTTLQVVAVGAVHDPRPILESRFGASYPFFLTSDSAIDFTDPGVNLLPGDVIGLTIKSDPLIGRYGYPLVGMGETPFVVGRDVAIGRIIDVADIYTGVLPYPPAIQVNLSPPVTAVRIDIKPGGFPNSINIGSNGTVAVAIFGSASFDATTVDPLTVTLAGAFVALKGKGTAIASFNDVDGDGFVDVVVHVSTDALQLTGTDTQAVLEGKTFDGTTIRGTDSVRVVN